MRIIGDANLHTSLLVGWYPFAVSSLVGKTLSPVPSMSLLLLYVMIVSFDYCMAQSGTTITLSWSNCTSSEAVGNVYNVSFKPETPSVGENFTITAVEFTSMDLGLNGFYHLNVTSLGMSLGSITDNLCNSSYLDLDSDMGRVYYDGIQCPINKGMYTLPQIGWINPYAPFYSGLTAVVEINAY